MKVFLDRRGQNRLGVVLDAGGLGAASHRLRYFWTNAMDRDELQEAHRICTQAHR